MKPLPKTVISIFRLLFRQIEHIMTNKRFLQVIFTGNFLQVFYTFDNSYGVYWVKDVEDNQIRLNNQQIKDTVAYLFCSCYFSVDPKIFCRNIGIPMWSKPVPFFANLFLCFYKRKRINEIKTNENFLKKENIANILGLLTI